MMIHDAVSAAYHGSYRIEVTFDDGKRGIIDFTPYQAPAFSSDVVT